MARDFFKHSWTSYKCHCFAAANWSSKCDCEVCHFQDIVSDLRLLSTRQTQLPLKICSWWHSGNYSWRNKDLWKPQEKLVYQETISKAKQSLGKIGIRAVRRTWSRRLQTKSQPNTNLPLLLLQRHQCDVCELLLLFLSVLFRGASDSYAF